MLINRNGIDGNVISHRLISWFRKTVLPSLLALYFFILLVWSWRKWPDVLVDFGRELYVPWQISVGKVLYQDIAHLFGPFSQYFNATLFYLFGPSYLVIIIANAIILAILLILIYSMFKRACSEWAAFIACGVIISIFSFSQYVRIGNYNFISPYAHEATHGTLLALLMIHQQWRFYVKNQKRNLVLAGFFLGVIFLTKIEILVSALAVTGFFLFLIYLNTKNTKETLRKTAILFIAGMVPVILFGIYFTCFMPIPDAIEATCGSLISIYEGVGIMSNAFYMRSLGLDNPFGNVIKMFVHSAIAVISILAILFLCHTIRKQKHRFFVVVLCVVILEGIIFQSILVDPFEIGRALPLLTILSIIFLFYSYLKSRNKGNEVTANYVLMLLWAVFALFMLLKMSLSCRIINYGFYLALPAMVLLVLMMIWYVPKWLDKRYGGGNIYKIAMTVMIIIFSINCLQISNNHYKKKNYVLGVLPDSIITVDPHQDREIYKMTLTLEWIHNNVFDHETVVVIPEGVMINYLTKRVNPTPYINFMVPEIQLYGENHILESFKNNSPDYFVIVDRDTSEYGYNFFGEHPEYGQKILNWINHEYDPVCLSDNEALKQKKFGIKVMKKINFSN